MFPAPRVTLFRDMSGASLHRRGYRQGAMHAAALNESAAAGALALAGWPALCQGEGEALCFLRRLLARAFRKCVEPNTAGCRMILRRMARLRLGAPAICTAAASPAGLSPMVLATLE